MKLLMFSVLLSIVSGCAQISQKDVVVPHSRITTANIKACNGVSNRKIDNIGGNFKDNQIIWNDFNDFYSDNRPRKIAIFLDGTGNNKNDLTNIRQLYRLSVEHACSGNRIIPYYDKGVGAKWFDFAPGGITGKGISKNIRQAYGFLVRTYKPGDEIFILGFSRGAFTARSLNGFIEFSGIIKSASIEPNWYDILPNWIYSSSLHQKVSDIYSEYKTSDDGTPSFETTLRDKILKAGGDLEFSYKKVTAIGVFDTVPALGISRNHEPDNHKIDLYAENGFHALALDEQRKDFRLQRFNPIIKAGSSLDEVWFIGVHFNVGGGYDNSMGCEITNTNSEDYYDGLESIPLNWMLSKFNRFNLFPQNLNFTECVEGQLHDEFFDEKIIPYKKMGISKRQPRLGDSVHSSVKNRTALNVGQLKSPHSQREPNGVYLTPNLKKPIDSSLYNIIP